MDIEAVLVDLFADDDAEAVPADVDEESDISEVDRHVEALEAADARWGVPDVPDDLLDDILGESNEEDVRPSQYGKTYRLERTPEPAERADEAEEEDANAHFEDLGGHAVFCPRGPNLHVALGQREALASRLACNAYKCGVCGPRQVYAVRGSARAIVRRTMEGWAGMGFTTPKLSPACQRALRRWAAKDSEHRAHLGFAITPDTVSYLLMWASEGHRPTGALADHLQADGAIQVDQPLHEVVDQMGADIDLIEWSHSERRAVILRGFTKLRQRIADLRDRVLGRSRARRADGVPPDPDKVAVRSYKTLTQVREEVSRRAWTDTVETDVDVDGRARTQTTRWGLSDPETPLKPFLRDMRDEGWFEKSE